MTRTGQEDDTSWLGQEIERSRFRDLRLRKRFGLLLERLWKGMGQTIPLACQDWANTKAAYRFMDNDRVNEQDILSGHFHSTAQRFSTTDGPILVLQDTTPFSYERERPELIGYASNTLTAAKRYGRDKESPQCGILMHSSLAVTTEGLPLGLASIKFWSRKEFKNTTTKRSKVNFTRIAAIRAMIEVGPRQDHLEVCEAFLAEAPSLRRSWLGELIGGLRQMQTDVNWLLAALEHVASPKRYETDPLSGSLASYVAELPPTLLPVLLDGLANLLSREPVVERRHCEVSKRYGWLCQTARQALILLIERRDAAALKKTALSILRQVPIAEAYGNSSSEAGRDALPQLVRGWPALNRALFWHSVAEARAWRKGKNGERLTDYWHVSMFGAYWAFGGSDFDYIRDEISGRPLLDDKLVALTLAVMLCHQNGRPRAWREALKTVSSADPDVAAELDKLPKPPKGAHTEFRRQEAAWKRQSEKAAKTEAAGREREKQILVGRVEGIRDPGKPGVISGDQHYLHDQMRGAEGQHNRWTEGNWRSLIEEFGQEIAVGLQSPKASG